MRPSSDWVEMHPPYGLPQGNVGTPETDLLQQVNQGLLPPRLLSHFGLSLSHLTAYRHPRHTEIPPPPSLIPRQQQQQRPAPASSNDSAAATGGRTSKGKRALSDGAERPDHGSLFRPLKRAKNELRLRDSEAQRRREKGAEGAEGVVRRGAKDKGAVRGTFVERWREQQRRAEATRRRKARQQAKESPVIYEIEKDLARKEGYDPDDEPEAWEVTEAALGEHPDVHYEKNDRLDSTAGYLYEDQVTNPWDKHEASGLVHYTDDSFWDAQAGGFDERTADDLDVTWEEAEDQPQWHSRQRRRRSRRGNKGDGEDMTFTDPHVQQLYGGPQSVFRLLDQCGFERSVRQGVAGRLLHKWGWRDGYGLGRDAPPLPASDDAPPSPTRQHNVRRFALAPGGAAAGRSSRVYEEVVEGLPVSSGQRGLGHIGAMETLSERTEGATAATVYGGAGGNLKEKGRDTRRRRERQPHHQQRHHDPGYMASFALPRDGSSGCGGMYRVPSIAFVSSRRPYSSRPPDLPVERTVGDDGAWGLGGGIGVERLRALVDPEWEG